MPFRPALVAAAAALGLISTSAGCQTVNTGRLRNALVRGVDVIQENRPFTEAEEYDLGRTAAATLLATRPVDPNAELTGYVNTIGQTLALASDRPELFHGYHFAVLDGPAAVNAYALPSGFIFVTRDLVASCKTEDELAGALAHEVAHVALKHPLGAVLKAHRFALVSEAVERGTERVPDERARLKRVADGLQSVSADVIDAVSHGYDRATERAADEAAVEVLRRVGYDPRSLADLLSRLERTDSGRNATHGDPQQRAAAVRALVTPTDPTAESVRTRRFLTATAALRSGG